MRPPGSPGTWVPCTTTTTRHDLEPEKDYVEPKLGLSHEFAGLPLTPRVSASVHYSPDFYLEAGDAVYVDGTVGMSLKGVLGGELPAQERPDLRGALARISHQGVISG